MLGNVSGLLNLILFVFLLTFLAAIFAAQIFRGDIPQNDPDDETIEVTFFTIFNSFLGMYQILSSENWTSIMYNITTYDYYRNTAWIGAAFCIIWFILGNCEFGASENDGMTDGCCSHRFEYVYCCNSRELRCVGRREAPEAGRGVPPTQGIGSLISRVSLDSKLSEELI